MPDDKKDLFIDDEPTSIAVDLTPPAAPPEKPAPSLADDDEEESTKVLDWDRAMRKSIEKK